MKFLPAFLPIAVFGAVNPNRRYVVQKPVEYISNNRPLTSVVYANGETALPTQTRPWTDGLWSNSNGYQYPTNYQGINQYYGYGNSVWNGWKNKIVEEAVEDAVVEAEVEEAVEEAIEDAVIAEEAEEKIYRPWSNYNNGNWPSNWYKNTDRKYYNNYQPYINREYNRYNALNYQQYRPIREYVKPVAAETVKVENWKNWQPNRFSLDSSAKLTNWNGRFNWMNYAEKPVKQNSYGKWLNKDWANIQKGYNGNWYKPSTYNYDSDKTRDALMMYALLKEDN